MNHRSRSLGRRAFLKAGAVAMVSFGAGPGFLGRAALAAVAKPGRPKVLVALFLRGAMDGLAAVTPLSPQRQLQALRPRLWLGAQRAAGAARLLDLGTGFGLHPAFAPLLPLWQAGQLAVVHAVGSPDPTRSHFDAQNFMETGMPGWKGTAGGWLNRVAGRLGHEATPLRAVALSQTLPRSLSGPVPALAIADLARFRVRSDGDGNGFEALYGEASQRLLRETARETFEAEHTLERLDPRRYQPAPGAHYPQTRLGNSLRQIAFLIRSQIGLEIAFAESGGWDTHVLQGRESGTFARRAADLGQSIAAFWLDLGVHRDDVALMTMTEFGRTAYENGSGGTDHGHGSCLFVLGTEVAGGAVHGSFPGIDRDALYEGRDLAVTTDFRSVFAEVAARHLGVEDDAEIFPGWQGPRLPLWRQPAQPGTDLESGSAFP